MPPVLPSDSEALDATFAALADSTRRRIVERLSRGPAPVGELAQPFDISWPAVTKHLRTLEEAGLVRRHPSGQHRILELEPGPMNQARAWMDHHRQFWEKSLDSLADYLERGVAKSAPRPAKSARPRPRKRNSS
jgi:DNA-binding transcriptional ArsR family regulator